MRQSNTKGLKMNDEQEEFELSSQRRLLFDYFKHLTTLNLIGIGLILTLCEKFFPTPIQWQWVGFSFMFFAFSLVISSFTQLSTIYVPKNTDHRNHPNFILHMASLMCFVAGVFLISG